MDTKVKLEELKARFVGDDAACLKEFVEEAHKSASSEPVTTDDIIRMKELLELELREQKANAHKRMAWISLWAIVLVTALLFSPGVTEQRIESLSNIIEMFYIACAGITGAYIGVSTWMSRR